MINYKVIDTIYLYYSLSSRLTIQLKGIILWLEKVSIQLQ